MLNLRNLIDLLPYYYKEADTYNDNDGRGILEKYLEIFGNYFDKRIIADTDSLLDINDIDKCDELYLNHIWEFTGQMPFADSLRMDFEKFKTYFHNSPNWKSLSSIGYSRILGMDYTKEKKRALVKYTIALYKIRGTKKFFEILFRLYGLECTITEDDLRESSYGDEDYGGHDDDYGGNNDDYGGKIKNLYSKGYLDSSLDGEDSKLDNTTVDRSSACNLCRVVRFIVRTKYYDILSINHKSYNSLFDGCLEIINRFIPVNVKAYLGIGSIDTSDIITNNIRSRIWLRVLDGSEKIIITDTIKRTYQIEKQFCDKYLYLQDGIRQNIQISVEIEVITDGFHVNYKDDYSKFILTTYRIFPNESVSIGSDGSTHNSGYILNITKEGNYAIVSPFHNILIPVVRRSSIRYYNIGYKSSSGTFKITPNQPSITILLTGTVSLNGVLYPANIRRVDTGEIYQVDSNGKYTLTLYQAGNYTFELVDYSIKKVNFTITKEDEVLDVTIDPEKVWISKGTLASTVLNVTGNYHKDKILAIQAIDMDGATVSYNELETFEDYFVTPPDYGMTSNIALSNGYAKVSIPLWDSTYKNNKPHARIAKVRVCCLANPIRETTQYVKIRKYDTNLNTLTDLFVQLKMNKGGYINSDGSIVKNSLYQYSDWIDVTQYQAGTGKFGAISRLEAWLICSPLTCYEVSRKDVLYNCGDTFTTDMAGSFTFVGNGDPGTGIKATFNVVNRSTISVSYSLTLSSNSLLYQKGSTSTRLLVTIGTSLSSEVGKDNDNNLNFGFELWKYNTSSSTWSKLKTISTSDSNWVVDTNVSRYTKRYSLELYNNVEGTGTFQIRSITNDFTSQTFSVSNYVDPNTIYLYLDPINILDEGWIKPDWSTADIGDSNNTPANATYDLSKGVPRFKVQVLNGDPDSLNDINISRVTSNGTTAIIDTVSYGDTISNLTTEGTYIFSVKGDSTVQTAKLIITKKVNFKITCNPSIAILKDSTVSTQVVASCDDPNVSSQKLQVKLVGDSTWYNTPYTFVAHTTGIYNFIVRGNEEGDEPTTTFQVISESTLGISPTDLTWESGDTTEKEVKLVGDDSLSWEIVTEDVDS